MDFVLRTIEGCVCKIWLCATHRDEFMAGELELGGEATDEGRIVPFDYDCE